MSTPKFTSGPWTLSEPKYAFKEDPGKLTSYEVYSSEFTWVASIIGEHCAVPREEVPANATLIAAAPDLYAACQRVLSELEAGITMGCEEDLREAIAKAEGGS